MSDYQKSMIELDRLADDACGYVSVPSDSSMAYTELLFDVCRQFGIRYYSATPKERAFADEVTRVTWARHQEKETGIRTDFRPSFMPAAV